jgi:DNA topoisomerase IB
MFPVVEMNPQYDAKTDSQWVFFTRQADGKPGGYYYTVDYRKNADTTKFASVEDLKDKIKSVRAKWLPLLKQGIKSPQHVGATILEILLQFSARIGTVGNAAGGQSTYGISTLRVKHVYPQPNGNMVIRYNGKDGVVQKHVLAKTNPYHKLVIANLSVLMLDKAPTDLLFTFKRPNGKQLQINATMVNRMFRSLGAGDVTIHKLRTLRGTMLFQEEMDKNAARIFDRKTPLTEKQAKEVFVKLAEKVGALLGHIRSVSGGTKVTGATALASYIDVRVQLDYWTRLNMRPPAALLKYMK